MNRPVGSWRSTVCVIDHHSLFLLLMIIGLITLICCSTFMGSRWSQRIFTIDGVEPNGNNESALSMIQNSPARNPQQAFLLYWVHKLTGVNSNPPARNPQQAFLPYWVHKLTGVNPNILFILMTILFKMICDVVYGTDPFKDLCDAINYMTSKVLLEFSVAFKKSLGGMVQMTMFMMVNAATLILASLSFKVLEATLVSFAPFYYFLPLLARAPNFSVLFGTFEVPIFWFVFSCALVFFFLQCFVIFGVLFISWKLMC
ncbi:hypothetical protein QN277_024218 [Acacia crassicarpa]|uniref:Uncharacterized protein n=1 Tax=Acacia crassicarpa TaxID=499986 RepID=A0AAE1JD87_9FABA|nr:hypothetical protein QN277_024218 [Acacia crassicarpa]